MNALLLDPVHFTTLNLSPRAPLKSLVFETPRRMPAETGIMDLKSRIRTRFRHDFEWDEDLLELVIEEAEELALETGFPLLFFPELAAEKARQVMVVLAARRSGFALSLPLFIHMRAGRSSLYAVSAPAEPKTASYAGREYMSNQ